MGIINQKFTPEELITIYGIEPYMGNVKDLNIYNSTPGFNIQKFYNNGVLVGYAAVFLGYNSITSTDASLEDVAFWQGTPEELDEFLKKVIKAQDYSFPIENFYYDPENFQESISNTLNKLGFKETTRTRWKITGYLL